MRKGDARRGELLATAERLFYTKGYEKTSVQDILNEMNFSKGGFYHHFDSKLSVLEAICQQRAQESCERATQAVAGGEYSAVERLNMLLHSTPLWGGDNQNFVSLLIRVAYREDGALMREKMKTSQLEGMKPVLEGILEQGLASGEFYVTDAEAQAEMLMRLYMQFTDEIAFLLAQEESEERLTDAMLRKLAVYRAAIERTLIAPFGSIVLFEAKELQLLGQAILRERVRARADAMLGAEK